MKKNQGTRFLYLLSTFLWIVVILLSIIAIVQLLEQLNIIPGMEVNKILAELYPYRKEMSERQLAASSGLQIKRLTMGQSTGTMQGHPIIFGNFMAFSLVFMAALIRSKIHIFLYIIGVIALLTSLSRGAWISYTFGILFFVFILSWPTIKKFILNPSISRNFLKNIFVLLAVLFGTGIVIINTPLYAPLSERISRTQIPIISSEGVPEGRLERVWPKAIESINEAGTLAWFIGIPGGYKHSTDSQYLLLLVNVGIIGIMIFVILHIYIAHLGYIFFQNWWKHDRQIARLGIGLCSAVIMLLFMYIVHPSFQDDKLVYFMFLLFIILRMNLSVSDDAVYRAKKRKFIVFA